MTDCKSFIEYFEELNQGQEMPEGAKRFYDNYICTFDNKKTSKVEITENGIAILRYMQDNLEEGNALSAKEIAEEIGFTSRSVSGSLRKLVTDGYVNKIEQSPSLYSLTEKGREKELKEQE